MTGLQAHDLQQSQKKKKKKSDPGRDKLIDAKATSQRDFFC